MLLSLHHSVGKAVGIDKQFNFIQSGYIANFNLAKRIDIQNPQADIVTAPKPVLPDVWSSSR